MCVVQDDNGGDGTKVESHDQSEPGQLNSIYTIKKLIEGEREREEERDSLRTNRTG